MEANTMNPDQRSRLKWVHIVIEATKVHQQIKNHPIFEPLHDISKNVVIVKPGKAQTSLPICTVWSEPLLVAWLFYEC